MCFDVDSTLSPDEGIDVLAAVAGKADEVAALTAAAMGGDMPFEVALAKRLAVIQPTKEMLARCLREHPVRLTPGARELIEALRARGTVVFLVSGGFTHMVLPLAVQLGIPESNVIANRLLFAEGTDDDGEEKRSSESGPSAFLGVDASVPTCRSGGKAAAIRWIRETLRNRRAPGSESPRRPPGGSVEPPREGHHHSLTTTDEDVHRGGRRAEAAADRDGDVRGKGQGGHPSEPVDLVAMVGDGVTDMEAQADFFVGFGGVVCRPKVRDGADWFVSSFAPLMDALLMPPPSSDT